MFRTQRIDFKYDAPCFSACCQVFWSISMLLSFKEQSKFFIELLGLVYVA